MVYVPRIRNIYVIGTHQEDHLSEFSNTRRCTLRNRNCNVHPKLQYKVHSLVYVFSKTNSTLGLKTVQCLLSVHIMDVTC